MSYARWSNESDVYVYHHVDGYVTCCGCRLFDADPFSLEPRDPAFYSRTAAIEHLERHRLAGHIVPDYAFDRLWQEIAELSDTAELGRRLVRRRKKVRVMKGLRRVRRLKQLANHSWHRYMKWSRIKSWKQITDYKEPNHEGTRADQPAAEL